MLLFIFSFTWFILILSTPAGVRISTFFPNRFSKKEESPIKFSIDGSSKSAKKSISLLSSCSPLTKDPKSPISLTLYFNKISLCFLMASSISSFVKAFFCFFTPCLQILIVPYLRSLFPQTGFKLRVTWITQSKARKAPTYRNLSVGRHSASILRTSCYGGQGAHRVELRAT